MGENRRRIALAIVLLAGLTSGCVVTPVVPLTAGEPGYAQDDDEKKIIRRAADLEDELKRKALLLQDEAVTGYVRAVGQRLIPPAAARVAPFHFEVLRDPVVNAFALPNGGIYLTVGLLARLENEAQLAHVLSHEIAHVVQRHGLQQHRSRKATIIAAHIADLALFGTSIAYLPAIGALASYSQESESEADRLALEYMAPAGYPLAGAEQLFRLLQEVKEKESVWGSVYSSHPDNQQRAQATKAIIDSGRLAVNAGGRLAASEYRAIRSRLILENLQLKLNVRQYELAADYAGHALQQAPDSPWLHYYRGEAHRLMAEDPAGAAREHAWIHDRKNDDELVESYRKKKPELQAAAREAYRQALAVDKNFVTAYRGLGLVAYAEGDHQTAREALGYYLAHGRDISDRRYINNIIGRMSTP
jgi:predicted Zn-dependent protease